MKKNPLSLFEPVYSIRYYLTHPWKWVHDFYWCIRNFFHRGRYGYAYCDVWEWYTWWTTVGAEALRYLAEHGHGYPGSEPYDTPEKWKEHLLNLANDLDWCHESCEFPTGGDNRNEYQPQYDEIHKLKHVWSNEEQLAMHKYWERQEELYKEDSETRAVIFSKIGRDLGRYWD